MASNGNNTVVSATAGRKIRVVNLFLLSSGIVTVTFQSGAGGTALTGGISLIAQNGFVLPYTDDSGWFETAAGSLLNINLNAGVSVDGALGYILI